MKDKNGKEIRIGFPCIIDIHKGELIEKKLGQVTGIVKESGTELATILDLDESVGLVYEVKAVSKDIEMK